MPRFRPKIAKVEARRVRQAPPRKTSKNSTKTLLKKNGAVCKVLRGRSTGQQTQRPAKTTNAKHHRDQNVTIRRVTRHDPGSWTFWPRWVGAISGQRAACTILSIGKKLLFCYIGKPDRNRAAQNRKTRIAQQAPKTRKIKKSKGTEKAIFKTIGFCSTRQTKNSKTPKSKKTGSETQTPKTKEKHKKQRRGTKTKQTEKTSFKVLGICYTAKTAKTNLHKHGLNPKKPKTTKDKKKGNKKTAKTIL